MTLSKRTRISLLCLALPAAAWAQAADPFVHRLISSTDRTALVDVLVSTNACHVADTFRPGLPAALLPPNHTLPPRMIAVTMTLKALPGCERILQLVRTTRSIALPDSEVEGIFIYTLDIYGKIASILPVRLPKAGS